ncbi:hypothetical protein HKD37_12G034114 [Glycine soja]
MIVIFVSITNEWNMHDSIMFEEVDMNVENEKDVGVKVEHIDCSDAFNTSQYLKNFEMACSPWPIDDLNENVAVVYTLLVESAHWSLKRLLQKSLGDIREKLSFSIQGLCEAEVTIIEEMETISKRFEELDVCGKVHLKEKFHEITYIDLNSVSSFRKREDQECSKKIADQTTKCIIISATNIETKYSNVGSILLDSIEYIIDVKADGNCGYHGIVALWEYINLLGGIERFEELKYSLLVDGLSMVRKFIVMSLFLEITFKSQPPPDSFVHRVICIGHVYENHFAHINVDNVVGHLTLNLFVVIPLSFTTIGIIVEYTLPLSGKVVAHPIHR